jgi:hypothetical protein
MMRGMGFNVATPDEMQGRILEAQRQKAYDTPTLVDDRFFTGEIAKWGQNAVEESSAYHALGMKSGIPIPANPFENRGDVALAFLKGGNPKDNFAKNYAFNPNVQTMTSLLPSGFGVQERPWKEARTGKQDRVDYSPAVNYLNAQEGRYGVYGNLAGGIPDKKPNLPPVSDRLIGGKIVATTTTQAKGNAQNVGGLPSPFRSSVKTELPRPFISSDVTVTPATGGIPFFKLAKSPDLSQMRIFEPTELIIPGISPILARFQEPTISNSQKGKPYEISLSKMGGVDYHRGFIDPKTGKETMELSFPVGEPITGKKYAVGLPVITTRYDPASGITETFSEQEYAQDISQNYETVRLSDKVTVTPITTFSRKGQSDLNKWVRSKIPELKPDDRNPSPLFASYQTNEGKNVYLLGSDLGPKVDTLTKGPIKFVGSLIPGSRQWSEETVANVRENPGFGLPMAAFSIVLVGVGTAGRSTGIGERLLAPTTRAGGVYQFGSQVASAGLVTLFADYGLKETTGTGLFDIASNEYRRAVTGGKSENTLTMMQKNFPGWNTASRKANRIELEAGIALGTYLGANALGSRITGFQRTRNTARMERQEELITPAREGFPVNPAIRTRDLAESFRQGRMATIPASNLARTRLSATGRRMTPADFPANPQRLAGEGMTDIWSGADYPHLNTGRINAGHSEIPGMSTSPSGLSHFTKPGTGIGSFGITNDLFGFYRLPTMYVTGVRSGRYTRVPERILRTPTEGRGINDPRNPRNIAIGQWVEANNVPYDQPFIGQHGKSEFEFHLRQGAEVNTQTIGYYVDAGVRIPIQRFTLTGRQAPGYQVPEPPGRTTNFFSGLPVKSSIGSSSRIPAPLIISSLTGKSRTSGQSRSSSVTPSRSSVTGSSRVSQSSVYRSATSKSSAGSRTTPLYDTSRIPGSSRTPGRTSTTTTSGRTGRSSIREPSITTSISSRSELTRTVTPSSRITRTTTPVITGLPGLAPGLSAAYARRKPGRKLTQIFGIDFGDIRSPIFGNAPVRRTTTRRTTKRRKK